MRFNNKKGATLIELLLVIILLSIFGSLCYPIATNVIQKCTEQSVICFAQSVEAAKISFRMRNPKANQEYLKQTTNEGRYDLIKEYLPNGNGPLTRALPPGYDLMMNASIDDRVEVINKKGEIVY